MFIFEKGSDIEAVSNVSEYLKDTLDIWDSDSAILYCIRRRTVASQ
jgi:hypothetical protein